MGYTRFEQLPCWQKARELCSSLYGIIQATPLRKDFAIRDQIWKAAGSVMDNIAEGFDNTSQKEFCRFLGYSLRSASEVQSQLYRALDCGLISEKDFKEIFILAQDCRKQIKGFRAYLQSYAIDKK